MTFVYHCGLLWHMWCGVWRWYIYVIYVLWNISVLWYIYICAVKCNAKKKIRFLRICRVLWPRHSAKKHNLPSVITKKLGEKLFLKKTKYCLKNIYRVSYSATLGICLLVAESNTRRKGFLKNPNTVWKIFAEYLTVRHSAYVYHLPSAALGEKEF